MDNLDNATIMVFDLGLGRRHVRRSLLTAGDGVVEVRPPWATPSWEATNSTAGWDHLADEFKCDTGGVDLHQHRRNKISWKQASLLVCFFWNVQVVSLPRRYSPFRD